jgi:hypothetical protein
MFRSSGADESESVPLNYEWSMRSAPPRHIVHVCGPAYAGMCTPVDDGSMRVARCERCGAIISYSALARLIRRVEGERGP